MLVQVDYSVHKSERDAFINHTGEKAWKEVKNRNIADNLVTKLAEFMDFPEEEIGYEVSIKGRVCILGDKDFLEIRGMLKRLAESHEPEKISSSIALAVDDILYNRFCGISSDLIFPDPRAEQIEEFQKRRLERKKEKSNKKTS